MFGTKNGMITTKSVLKWKWEIEVDTTEDMCLALIIFTFLLLFLCVLWIPICLHYCHVLLSVLLILFPQSICCLWTFTLTEMIKHQKNGLGLFMQFEIKSPLFFEILSSNRQGMSV